MATPAASPLLLPLPLPLPASTFPPRRAVPCARRLVLRPPRAGRPRLRDPPPAAPPPAAEEVGEEEEDDDAPPLRLLEPPQDQEDYPSENVVVFRWSRPTPISNRIGYARMMRAYGVEFLEGPDGMAVYASRDVDPLRRARVIMEIPLELMLTITQKRPWMFFPDIIPLGHPIFDIIESTDPE
ncbi:hypothetical protein OsJ_00234 [Oryza sativa Japonica Group]|uniref:Uncharacterized protein n=1 Tax=Oryza sativa subsp. japonica TaxID=39947 RepID=B9EZB8_ORYSJ|nr:hypothetical protein OsJ_00234 [Oryza sativa Japonica Group]